MSGWEAHMDFGVVHALAFPECRSGEGPILETLELLVDDADFSAVEIAPVRDPMIRAKAMDRLRGSGMQVVYLPILPIIFQDWGLGSADADVRNSTMERLHALILEAVAFDCPLAMITGPKDPGEAMREETFDRLITDIQSLCDFADASSHSRRLHLTLENFDRDIEKKRLIGPTKEAVELARFVNRSNFGLTLDLSHLPLLGEAPSDAVAHAVPYMLHAHIGNCVADDPTSPLYGDFHPRFGYPGSANGVNEVVEYLCALNQGNFWSRTAERLGGKAILSMELKPAVGESPKAILGNGKRMFRRAWALSQEAPEEEVRGRR